MLSFRRRRSVSWHFFTSIFIVVAPLFRNGPKLNRNRSDSATIELVCDRLCFIMTCHKAVEKKNSFGRFNDKMSHWNLSIIYISFQTYKIIFAWHFLKQNINYFPHDSSEKQMTEILKRCKTPWHRTTYWQYIIHLRSLNSKAQHNLRFETCPNMILTLKRNSCLKFGVR